MAEGMNDGNEALTKQMRVEILDEYAKLVPDVVSKAAQIVQERHDTQRQERLLETSSGCKVLLAERKRPKGGGSDVSLWFRQQESLEARALALESLEAHEARLSQMDSQGDQSSAARSRVTKEIARLKAMTGRP